MKQQKPIPKFKINPHALVKILVGYNESPSATIFIRKEVAWIISGTNVHYLYWKNPAGETKIAQISCKEQGGGVRLLLRTYQSAHADQQTVSLRCHGTW